MPPDQPNPATSDYPSLTPEQLERRRRASARSDRALYRLMIFVSVITIAAGLIVRSLDANTFERALPIAFGFLIVYASLLLALLIVIFRNRPMNYLTTLRS